ncbi:ammonium transporter [Pilimelia terevasa]|uniref:Ammonium transporter n=1 Tax=Pilimelia terevasa TaxID=53372 RepID=A0A8J3FJB5_9ACTN|nr:ammonium transporter [Pilimelia terevasa]GGK36086.1 ammonium transporter [Pilimelia terevasa]
MPIDTGATAWMLAATALVLLMTPGLAFFYGGLTSVRGALNMMMMSFVSIATVTVAWVLYGHSLAFDPAGDAAVNAVVGGLDHLGLQGLVDTVYPGLSPETGDNLPQLVFSAFQLTFAVITVALVSGAVVDRARFTAWVVFSLVYATVVYFPVAHWVWGGGWLAELGIEDFAGGTVVHINAGAAALALTLVLGRRHRPGHQQPHNVPLVLLGAGLLWFGWFGFNAGSELAVDSTTALAFMNTLIASAVGAGVWLAVDKYRHGHYSAIGIASGAVAGLVAITPACGFVDPWAAAVIGAAAGAICAWAVELKNRLGYDDSLDVVGVHLVGGLVGAVSLGILARYTFLPQQHQGLLYGGGLQQLGLQLLGPLAVGLYAFGAAWAIAKVIDRVLGFRIPVRDEVAGIDITSHAVLGYDLREAARPPAPAVNGTPAKVDA